MGQAPPGESYNSNFHGLPLIAGAGDFSKNGIQPKKYTTSPSKQSIPGDIILGIRASIGDKRIADKKYALGRGVASIRPTDQLSPRFLWHWIGHFSKKLSEKGKGATFKQVNRKDIGELPIHVLPLSEQLRIADVLDRADELRAKRRRAITLLDDLAQSLFTTMFGDPDKYPVVSLGELAEVTSGITKGRKISSNIATRRVPYLAVLNVQDKYLDLTTVKSIDVTHSELDRYRLRHGDLVLTEGGDPDKLGRGTVWQNEIEQCIHQNHIFRVRINSYSPIKSTYLNWLIASNRGKQYFLRSAKQTTGIASINATQLRNFPVAVPSADLQERFIQQIEAVAAEKRTHLSHLAHLDAFFASLRSRAFRGELWQTDLEHLEGEGLS